MEDTHTDSHFCAQPIYPLKGAILLLAFSSDPMQSLPCTLSLVPEPSSQPRSTYGGHKI